MSKLIYILLFISLSLVSCNNSDFSVEIPKNNFQGLWVITSVEGPFKKDAALPAMIKFNTGRWIQFNADSTYTTNIKGQYDYGTYSPFKDGKDSVLLRSFRGDIYHLSAKYDGNGNGKILHRITIPDMSAMYDYKFDFTKGFFEKNYLEQKKSLLEITKELQPNGGRSIKDQVKQIADDVRIIRVERDATFHLAKEPMFKTDNKGYYISCNTALCNLVGVPEQELLGLGWLNYISLEDKDRIWEEWENIIESGKEISTFFTIKNPESMEMIPVKCRAVINRSGDSVISIIGSIEKTIKKSLKIA